MNYKDIKEVDYWRINKSKNSTYSIEWTAKRGGVVRAKLDSLAEWQYKSCSCVKYALQLGYQIIDNQKLQREYQTDAYEECYFGA